MKLSQILTYELEDQYVRRLGEITKEARWRLRQFRQAFSLFTALKDGANLVILQIGHDLYEELLLLKKIRIGYPEIPVLILGSNPSPGLAELCWDLGAAAVILPPISTVLLEETVRSFSGIETG